MASTAPDRRATSVSGRQARNLRSEKICEQKATSCAWIPLDQYCDDDDDDDDDDGGGGGGEWCMVHGEW